MIITLCSLFIAASICAVILQRRQHAAYLAKRDAFLSRIEAQNNVFAKALESFENK
jgi:hypothetical protein